MSRILSVSGDTHLLVTRNHALAAGGYCIASPKLPEDAPLLFAEGNFQAVIIGHSVIPDVRKRIIPSLRKTNSAVPIIFVFSSPESGSEPLADLSVDVSAGPSLLLFVLNARLLKRR
jgi:hypothetical protein